MSYSTRADFSTIAGWIQPSARVLDLGCGDGGLLAYLRDSRGVVGYGIEIDDGTTRSRGRKADRPRDPGEEERHGVADARSGGLGATG